MKKALLRLIAGICGITLVAGLSGCYTEVYIPYEDTGSSSSVSSSVVSTEAPVSSSPAESKPAESKPAESKPTVSTPAGSKPVTSKPVVSTPSSSSPSSQAPVDYDYQLKNVTPTEDTSVVLHNPDMGWVLYENFIISSGESAAQPSCPVYGYDFPGVDHVMLKFTWADIERGKDNYDFTRFDYIYDYWAKRGKTIQMGMSTDSLLWYGSRGTGIPQYVLDEIPENKKQVRTHQNIRYTVCDANVPYFQERLEKFLKAMQAHFDETNRPVDYIDLRGYGLWGEWHQGYQYESLDAKRKALNKICEIWSKSFPDAWLALSYSYDPDEPREYYSQPNQIEKYMEWSAFDLARKYSNITWRRDGCGGAIQKNERTFCEFNFAGGNRGPFTSEGAGGYSDRGSAEYIVNDGLTLHPNYFTVVGWTNQQAKDFIEKEPDLFTKGLNNMGYRFVPTKISYPDSLVSNGKTSLTITLVNKAVGRAMRDYTVRLILTDKDGKVVSTMDAGSVPTSTYIKGETYNAVTLNFQASGNLKKGTYSATVALYDEKTESYVGMAVKGNGAAKDTGGVCVGQITVK